MDQAETERFLTSIDTVECCFSDTWGILVGRRMPTASFLRAAEQGLSMPNAPFAWNIAGDIDATPYANADTGFPNMHVMPDLATLRPAPWAERTAFCLMDAYVARDGAPNPLDPRGDPASIGRNTRRRGVRGVDRFGARVLPLHRRLGAGLRRP